MKSAYEIAMERLEKESGPSKKLTEEQKSRIADVEKCFDAKAAELKLDFETRFAAAASLEEFNTLKAEMASALRSVEEKRDREKDAIWNE